MGWLEGALRLFPAVRLEVFGYRVPEIVVSGRGLPDADVRPAVRLAGAGPPFRWRPARAAGDGAPPPRAAARPPERTALGVAVLAFYVVLFIGGGQDIIAQQTDIDIGTIRLVLQDRAGRGPRHRRCMAWKLCRDLAAEDRQAESDRRRVSRRRTDRRRERRRPRRVRRWRSVGRRILRALCMNARRGG